jgi:hypothetical protein
MHLTPRALAAGLLLVFAAAGCGERNARTEADTADAEAVVTGFASVEWGTPLAEILHRRGEPMDREEAGNGVTGVAFHDTVLMRPATAMFLVHAERGLLEGSYIVHVPEGTSCVVVYDHFYATIRDTYPALAPEERPIRNPDQDYCAAARSGTGGRVTTWVDPANDARIQLVLAPPGQALVVLYRSAAARELAQEKSAKQF